MIYLDSAATTLQKPGSVALASANAIRRLSSPGRGGHAAAMRAAETAYECRRKAAKLFNVPEPDNVVITFNATHGLNMAIRTLASGGESVVVSGYEHNAVMRPLYDMGSAIRIVRSELFNQEEILNGFDDMIRRDTGLVVCTHVSNVFGFILPVEKIAEICRQRGVPLIIDASQSAGSIDIDFERLGAQFIAMPGHKGLYGPQGTGLLLCGMRPKSLMLGGTGGSSRLKTMPDFLPDGAEAGTHNMPGISGLIAGMDFVSEKTPGKLMDHERWLIRTAARQFERIEGLHVYVSREPRVQSGVLSIAHDCIDSEQLAGLLSQRNIAVRAGLHCAPLAHETAGTWERGTVRLSVSAFNTEKDIRTAVSAVRQILSDGGNSTGKR